MIGTALCLEALCRTQAATAISTLKGTVPTWHPADWPPLDSEALTSGFWRVWGRSQP